MYRLRTARKCDLSSVKDLDIEVFPDLEPYGDFDSGITKVISRRRPLTGMESHRIVAFGHLLDGCIDRLGVDATFRRRGLGRKILKSLVSAAKRQGLLRVYTHICRENVASMMLFLRAGFKPVGDMSKDYWINWEKYL